MNRITKIYHPITASPFSDNDSYRELPPCSALKPYIRCFWGTSKPSDEANSPETQQSGIFIPDTCMDIIFETSISQNHCGSYFCTIDEHSHLTGGSDSDSAKASTFAIRFYAWSAVLFSDCDFRGKKNSAFDSEEFFGGLRSQLEPVLFIIPDLKGKAAAAEKLLIERLHTERINNDLMNAVYCMMESDGRAKISDICTYTALSERKLERIFGSHIGVSPKSFCSLLRYQLLWQEMVFSPGFNILDAVEKYGYTDQAHLLNDFRKRHLMTPKEALSYALKSQ